MTSTAVLNIAKRLQELEGNAKLLRNEVANLEATQRNLAISETTTMRALEIRRQTEEDEGDENEGSSKRRHSGRQSAQTKQLPLPQDFIDDLAHKASDVQATVSKHRALLRERDDLLAILDRVEGEAATVEQNYLSVAELVGADEDGHSAAVAGLRKKNECSAANKELLAFYCERELLRKTMDRQADELGRMSAMVADTANAEEQKAEAVGVLAEKRAKLAEMRRQREQLERTLRAKEGVLEKKPVGPSSEEIIRSANYDRRVALHELEKESEQLKRNDAAVRTRAMQIAKAEKRIEMIGDAVAGNGLDEEDRVDVELMENLINETNGLYNLHQEASIRMSMLDAKVEKIDYRIVAVTNALHGTDRERERMEREHAAYLSKLQQEYNREQNRNTMDIGRAENEVLSLRGRSSGRTAPNRASVRNGKARASAKA